MEPLHFLPDLFTVVAASTPDILATTGSTGATNFLDSTLGNWIKAIAGAVGLIVAIIGVFKAISSFLGGKVGAGVKVIIFTILIAGLLFNLSLLITGATWLGGVIGDAIKSFQGLG